MSETPSVNGLFLGQAQIAADLKNVIRVHLGQRRKQLAPDQMEALDIMCTSVAAMINGDPDNVQNWGAMHTFSGVVIDRLMGTGQYKELAEKYAAIREQEAKEQAETQANKEQADVQENADA